MTLTHREHNESIRLKSNRVMCVVSVGVALEYGNGVSDSFKMLAGEGSDGSKTFQFSDITAFVNSDISCNAESVGGTVGTSLDT